MIQYEKYEPLIEGPFKSVDEAIGEASNALKFIKIFIPTAKLVIGGSVSFYKHFPKKDEDITINDIDALLICNRSSSRMVYHWAATRPAGTFKLLPDGTYIVPVGDVDLHITCPSKRMLVLNHMTECEDTEKHGVFLYNKKLTYLFYKSLNREKDQAKLARMKDYKPVE